MAERWTLEGERFLLVEARKNDPFYAGQDWERGPDEWFAEIYHRLGYGNRRVHIRFLRYVFVGEETNAETGEGQQERLPDGQPYENTDEKWVHIQEAAKYARNMGLVSPWTRRTERRVMNKARNFTQASPELERLYWSIHEAGHAVAGCLSGFAVDYATILANRQADHGGVHYLHKGRRLGEELTEAEMIKDLHRMLRVDAAGAVAEYIAYTREEDVEPLPYWREVEEDGLIAEALMVEVDKLHPGLAMSLPTEFGRERLLPETQAMLTEHWGAVMEVAASLCTKKLVGGGEVRAAVRRQRTDRS